MKQAGRWCSEPPEPAWGPLSVGFGGGKGGYNCIPSAGLRLFELSWTSRGSCQPVPPACPGHAEQQPCLQHFKCSPRASAACRLAERTLDPIIPVTGWDPATGHRLDSALLTTMP